MAMTTHLRATEAIAVVVVVDGAEDEATEAEAEEVDTHLRKGIGPVLTPRVEMSILLGEQAAIDVESTNPSTGGDPRAGSRLAQMQLKKAKVSSRRMIGSVASAATSTGREGQLAMCAMGPSSLWRRSGQGSVEDLMNVERWSTRSGKRAMTSSTIWAGRRRSTRCPTRSP